MSESYFEALPEVYSFGVHVTYNTVPGGYHPLHWHEALEILYPLNGEAEITIAGKTYRLHRKEPLVVESGQVHSTYTYKDLSMFICIHITKHYIKQYLPDVEQYQITCRPDLITDETFPAYREICSLLEEMIRLHMYDPVASSLEIEGLILQIYARLVRHFSRKGGKQDFAADPLAIRRIREVLAYTEEHFREPVSLDDMTRLVGLGKESFCRFFKKQMGISFLNYLTEVRLSHVYRDLVATDEAVATVMERNGFTNQKLFNRAFKALYGETPSSVRREYRGRSVT